VRDTKERMLEQIANDPASTLAEITAARLELGQDTASPALDDELEALLTYRSSYDSSPPPVSDKAWVLYMDISGHSLLGHGTDYNYLAGIDRIAKLLEGAGSPLIRETALGALQNIAKCSPAPEPMRALADQVLHKYTTPESPAEGTQND